MFTPDVLLGWIVAIFVGLLALVVLWKIFTDKIDLKYLIAEESGDASMARFQFLVFTFVIAGGLAFLVLSRSSEGAQPGFPNITEGVLILLGISGGSYAIGKGLSNQAAAQENKPTETPNG